MRRLSVLCFIIFFYIDTINSESNTSINENGVIKYTLIDNIVNELYKQQWKSDEDVCLNETLTFLYGVKNQTLWASWIWDSIQWPTGTFYGSKNHLGSYDQCLVKQMYETQYCLSDINISSDIKKWKEINPYEKVGEYFSRPTKLKRKLNTISWGLCLPASCDRTSIERIIKSFYKNSHLYSTEPQIKIISCQKSNQNVEYSKEYYGFVFLVMILSTIVLCSTFSTKNNKSTNNDINLSSIMHCFCMKRNYDDLTKENNSELPSINIMKTINSTVTATSHFLYFYIHVGLINALLYDKIMDTLTGGIYFHLDVGVEFFYAVSGLLLVKSLMKNTNPFKFLLLRYIRLVAPLAFMIFYVVGVSRYIGDGPIWDKHMIPEENYCKKNWWLSILMVNNYVNSSEICNVIWWYIPSDFHMSIAGTVLFLIYKKNKIGRNLAISFSIIIISIPGFVTYWNRYSHMPFVDLDTFLNVRQNVVFLDTYFKTHNRMGSYIVGMITGYIISVYRPKDYKGIINKKWSLIGLLFSSFLMCSILYVAALLYRKEYNALESGFYAATNRTLWSLATCCIILVLEYGDLDFLNKLMNNYMFIPLSRLSYAIYLSHTCLISRNLYSIRAPMAFDTTNIFISGAGILVSTILASIGIWFLVEAPFGNLSVLLISSKSKTNKIKNKMDSKENEALRNNVKLLKNGS